MKIIPVVDIKNGQVVAAKQGQRELYQPIQSSLCNSCNLEDIISALLSFYPFETIYLADLNAITQTGHNNSLILQTIQQWPNLTFWLDNGLTIPGLKTLEKRYYKPVIGTESQFSNTGWINQKTLSQTILSLDFQSRHFCLDPAKLLAQPDCWPNEVIVMSLDRVGSRAGPDLEQINIFKQQYPDKQFIAAGGIRDQRDLLSLDNIGIKQVLVSSALHNGKITHQIIEQWSKSLTSSLP